MKKIFLGILALSLMFVMIGSASAVSPTITNPSVGNNILGTYTVQWNNPGSGPGYYLQYNAGSCTTGTWTTISGPLDNSITSYPWNTKSVLDGQYCLRLEINDIGTTSGGLFTIDNTKPQVAIQETTIPYFGADEKNIKAKVLIYYNDDVDSSPTCKINWNDGTALEDCLATGLTSEHQYGDNGVYNVVVTVTDDAGNSATDSVSVSVKNVDPTVSDITTNPTGITDVAFGQAVTFDAIANDVVADLNAKLNCIWTFDKGTPSIKKIVTTNADVTGKCEVTYTWETHSTHTVDLTVEDKDDGSVNANQYTIEVVEPEHMTPMQQVVQDKVFGFDLDSSWNATLPNRFRTSFANSVICTGVSVPSGMIVNVPTGNSRCQVDWTPTNAQRGEHLVIIRAEDSVTNEYKYYSFDVTVYSWGIDLVEGWNLISIPYIPTDSNIDKVFADILPNVAYVDANTATVLQYDAVANKWYKARPTSTHSGFTWSSPSSKLTNVVPGYGYWIKMDNADTIYGIEENFNPGVSPVPSVTLVGASWNLIGRYGTNPISMTDLNKTFETLEGYWFSDGFLKFDGISSYQPATSIDVGNGYWLRTKILPDGQISIAYEPLSYYFD